jgi:hypothetical protein
MTPLIKTSTARHPGTKRQPLMLFVTDGHALVDTAAPGARPALIVSRVR